MNPCQPNATTMRPRVLASLLFWSYLVATAPFGWFIVCWTAWLSSARKREQRIHQITRAWANHLLWAAPTPKLRFVGLEQLPTRGPFLICANHSSAGDILLLFRLPVLFKWIAKQEMFRVPFVGWTMRLNGDIALDRHHNRGAMALLRSCQAHLQAGRNVLIFPEGTRSKDGTLGDFRQGLALLARHTKVPVVPVVVVGASRILPARSLCFVDGRSIPIEVHILPATSGPASAAEDEAWQRNLRRTMLYVLAQALSD